MRRPKLRYTLYTNVSDFTGNRTVPSMDNSVTPRVPSPPLASLPLPPPPLPSPPLPSPPLLPTTVPTGTYYTYFDLLGRVRPKGSIYFRKTQLNSRQELRDTKLYATIPFAMLCISVYYLSILSTKIRVFFILSLFWIPVYCTLLY